jgi:hypothetical protein
MKKFVCTLVFIVLSTLSFAEELYTVEAYTGRVEREASPNRWEVVTQGMTLSSTTVINVGLNSTLTLKSAGKTITIAAMQRGTIATLSASGRGKGIRIGGKVAETNTDPVARKTTAISTASSRASDATQDLEWAEEAE